MATKRAYLNSLFVYTFRLIMSFDSKVCLLNCLASRVLSLSKTMETNRRKGIRSSHCPELSICTSGQTLTDICDVEREPKEERVADELREEQTQGELYHPLKERVTGFT